MRHVETFLAVVECGSFRGAARMLNVAQPALSRTIRGLEDALGLQLIERGPGRFTLTAAGASFAAGGAQLMQDAWGLAHMAARASKGLTGELRVCYTDFAIAGSLPGIVNAFRLAYPDVGIAFTPMVTTEQISALRDGRCDVGLLTGPVCQSILETRLIQRDEVVVAMPERHPLARGPRPTLADLAEEAFVLGDRERWAQFLAHVSRMCQDAGFLPNVVQEAADSEAILSLVAAGIGVTLTIAAIGSRRRSGVAVRHLAGEPYTVPTLLASHRESQNRAVVHFRAVVKAATRRTQHGSLEAAAGEAHGQTG